MTKLYHNKCDHVQNFYILQRIYHKIEILLHDNKQKNDHQIHRTLVPLTVVHGVQSCMHFTSLSQSRRPPQS